MAALTSLGSAWPNTPFVLEHISRNCLRSTLSKCDGCDTVRSSYLKVGVHEGMLMIRLAHAAIETGTPGSDSPGNGGGRER